MPIPALIGAAGALLASGANALFNKSNNKANVANQWELFNAQNRRQDWLNANADLIKRNSLLKAGLNVNSDFGGSPNLVGSTPSPATQQAFQIDPNLMLQAPSLLAQARLTNAQAENQEILNNRENSKDNQANKFMTDYQDFVDKIKGLGIQPELVGLADKDGGELPEFVKSGKAKRFNMGDFEFKQLENKFANDLREFDYNDMKWSLEKMVMRAQGDDATVLRALVQLPVESIRKLAAETSLAVQQARTSKKQGALFDAEAAFVNLQKKIAQDNNLSQIFDSMLKDGITVENAGKMLIACLINFFKPSLNWSFK